MHRLFVRFPTMISEFFPKENPYCTSGQLARRAAVPDRARRRAGARRLDQAGARGRWRWPRPRGSWMRRRSRSRRRTRPRRRSPAAAGGPARTARAARARSAPSDEPRPPPAPDLERQRLPARGRRTSPTCAASRTCGYALEVAAAGGHSLLIIGPPGAGKSLAARRLPVDPAAARAAPRRSRCCGSRAPAAGARARSAPPARPFRAPHHTISAAGLVGGGSPPRAGRGDARPPRRAVPRRAGGVLARGARGAATAARGGPGDDRSGAPRGRAPCRFMLVAASNPCPCGRGEESGRVRVPAGVDAPLPRQAERRARRPDRHRDLGRAPERRGDGRARRPATRRASASG